MTDFVTVTNLLVECESIVSEMFNHMYTTSTIKKGDVLKFFCLYLKTVVTRATMHKTKLEYNAALSCLGYTRNVLDRLQTTKKADLVHYVIMVYRVYMMVYIQLNKYDQCVEYANKCLYFAMKELDMRLSNNGIYTKDKAKKYKINRMFETIALTFYDLSFAYEGKKVSNYS